MASYDPYDAPTRERTTKRYYREERVEDPRAYDSRDPYRSAHPAGALVPRHREDSDLSVEEIRRDFPPPGYSSRDLNRARSAEPGAYGDYDDRRSVYRSERGYDRGYDRDYDRDYDRRPRKAESIYYEREERKKVRMLSKQEQIIAAITGAAIAIGGKELYDRREANQHGNETVDRNILASAALGAAGAFAGYSGTQLYNKKKEKDVREAVTHKTGYYSDDEFSAKENKGHKNFLESALAAAGLGGAVKALTGKSDDKSDAKSRRGSSRSRSRSRSTSRSSSRTRSRGDKDKNETGAKKVQKAAMASLIAGATEAFRISKQPGSWKGEKMKRIVTAAAGAATLDAAQDPGKAGSKLGLTEAVLGGLLGNRVIHGSKKNIEMDEKTGRSRSRSRARSKSKDNSGGGSGGGVSGLAALATAGLGAFGAKKIMDHREESRSRNRSAGSYDSRDGSPRRHRSRSRSVVDSARRGMAKIGIGNGPDDDDRDHHKDRSRSRDRSRRREYDDHEDSGRSRRHRDDYDDYDRDKDRDRRHHDDDRSHKSGGGRDRDRSKQQRRGSVSSDDLGDSEDDEKRGKKMRGKQILTTGLAAVATIHAAHNVYQSMEKRHLRHKAVKEGKLSEEQAKKMKHKALLQDAASVGIAALGIKGAISEIKEARELQHEVHEWRMQKEERKKRRLERQLRLRNGGIIDDDGNVHHAGDNGDSNIGRHRAESWYSTAPTRVDRYYHDDNGGPRYLDGNPYAALPSIGHQSDRR